MTNHLSLLIVASVLMTLFCVSCKDSSTSPSIPLEPAYDWEGESGKYNEPYRDSVLFNSDRCLGTGYAPSIHMMYKDGSGMRAKTTQWFTFAAAWSPRKWKIFYIADTAFDKPARGLFVMNADGTSKTRLTPPSEDVWGVSCAPDGKKVVYIVLNGSGQGKMRIANPDGTNAGDISGFFGAHSFHTVSWSSDSRRIVFDGHPSGIGIVNADGTGFGALFSYPYQCWEPNWSPDGSKIAFATFVKVDSTYYSNIFCYELATQRISQVTRTQAFDGGPHWSPDSRQIMFSSRLPGLYSPDHLFIINADGTGLSQLTNEAGTDWRPEW